MVAAVPASAAEEVPAFVPEAAPDNLAFAATLFAGTTWSLYKVSLRTADKKPARQVERLQALVVNSPTP